MPRFLYVYHGGSMPQSPEESERVMAAWTSWMSAVGSDMVDAGAPVGKSSTVKPGGAVEPDGGANPASGYSVVQAPDLAAAQEYAKTCPILEAGGSVEIAEVLEM